MPFTMDSSLLYILLWITSIYVYVTLADPVSKRCEAGGSCSPGEFCNLAEGNCQKCSEICKPEKGRKADCKEYCPDVYNDLYNPNKTAVIMSTTQKPTAVIPVTSADSKMMYIAASIIVIVVLGVLVLIICVVIIVNLKKHLIQWLCKVKNRLSKKHRSQDQSDHQQTTPNKEDCANVTEMTLFKPDSSVNPDRKDLEHGETCIDTGSTAQSDQLHYPDCTQEKSGSISNQGHCPESNHIAAPPCSHSIPLPDQICNNSQINDIKVNSNKICLGDSQRLNTSDFVTPKHSDTPECNYGNRQEGNHSDIPECNHGNRQEGNRKSENDTHGSSNLSHDVEQSTTDRQHTDQQLSIEDYYTPHIKPTDPMPCKTPLFKETSLLNVTKQGHMTIDHDVLPAIRMKSGQISEEVLDNIHVRSYHDNEDDSNAEDETLLKEDTLRETGNNLMVIDKHKETQSLLGSDHPPLSTNQPVGTDRPLLGSDHPLLCSDHPPLSTNQPVNHHPAKQVLCIDMQLNQNSPSIHKPNPPVNQVRPVQVVPPSQPRQPVQESQPMVDRTVQTQQQERPPHPNKWIYDLLKGIDWVEGYYSEGRSIEVYCDLTYISPDVAMQELEVRTGESREKFHLLQSDQHLC